MPLVSLPFEADATLPTGRKQLAGSLEMTAIGAIAQFEIYSTFPGFADQQIVSVELTAQSGIAGDFTWDFAAENPAIANLTATSAKTTVNTTANVAAAKADAAKVYMVLAPGEHAVTAKVTTTEGAYSKAVTINAETGKITPVEINLEDTEWTEAKIYRYKFAAEASDELFGGLTKSVGFFTNATTVVEKTLAEGGFFLDSEEAIAEGTEFYAYYPYAEGNNNAEAVAFEIPATQALGEAGSYNPGIIPVAAAPAALEGTANNGVNATLSFRSLAAVMKLNIIPQFDNTLEEKIESVTLSAEGIAGKFTWNITDETATQTLTEAADAVTATLAQPALLGKSGEVAAVAELVVLPGTYTGTLTVKTNRTDYEIVLGQFVLTAGEETEIAANLPTKSNDFGASIEDFQGIEGITPVFPEDAKICIYGADQTEIEVVHEGSGNFVAPEEAFIEGPFYALYPHNEDNKVDFKTGIFTGKLPAEQVLAEGAKMYDKALAYFAKSSTPSLNLKNATSLVKVAVANPNVSAITLTAKEGQFLAGEYTVNITDQGTTVAAVEGKGEASVTLKPAGETFAPGDYYIAVLPGATENISIDFTIKTTDAEETASKTRALESAIERNSGRDLGLFLGYNISNAEELLAWNNDYKEWTKWDIVTLTDNIDCSGVITSDNWTLRNFSGTLEGNSKTINNFVIEKAGPAAFFNTIQGDASIKNITFGEGCSTKSTAAAVNTDYPEGYRVYTAMVAVLIKGNAKAIKVINNGSVSVDVETITAAQGNYIGGLFSRTETLGEISGCQNHGDVTFSATPTKWTCVGGITGETSAGTYYQCENYGKIEFNGAHNAGNSINLAGICGGAKDVAMSYCTNYGTIVSNAEKGSSGGTNIGGIVGHNNGLPMSFSFCTNGSSTDKTLGELSFLGATTGDVRMGGCVAFIQDVSTNVTNFTNYGTITLDGGKAAGASIGGTVGKLLAFDSEGHVSLCKNYADITIAQAISSGSGGLGGIVGMYNTTDKKTIDNVETPISSANLVISTCENHGKIERNTAGSSNFHVGGIVGGLNSTASIAKSSLSGCTNNGQVVNSSSTYGANHYSYTGGVVGYARSEGPISNCTNNGSVTSEIFTNGTTAVRVGGIAGGADNGKLENCTNNGEVKENSFSAGGAVGGIVGWAKSRSLTLINCDNTKSVSSRFDATEGGKIAISNIYLGGIIGAFDKILTMTDCDNSGSVTNNCKASANIYIGGLAGYASKVKATISKSTNSGVIEHKSASTTGKIAIGGFIGLCYDNEIDSSSSTGSITNNCTVTANEYMGGFVGQVDMPSSSTNPTTKITNCSYNAALSVKVASRQYSGALIGRLTDKSSDDSISTVTGVTVKGSVAGTTLASDNFKDLCYGVSSNKKPTDGITLAQ